MVLGLGSIVATWPSFSQAQAPASQVRPLWAWKDIPAIVILSAEDDSRVPAIREAVEFWNAELAQLGSPFRFGAIVHSLRTLSIGDLHALSREVSNSTRSRLVITPSLLNSVREANGDVIIVLSDEVDFDPFTSPLPAPRKVLIVIPSFRKYPLTLSGLTRNVVAHELGHAVGLGHNDDATSLMCGGGARCPLKLGDRFFRSQLRRKQRCSKCIRRIGNQYRSGGGRQIRRPTRRGDGA
jgi:hypothetical protein